MPLRVQPQVCQRLFSTSARARATIPSQFHSYSAAAPHMATAAPKLGRIGKWYLPTMAAIAIGFGIANALDEHNYKVNRAHQMTQEERNMMLLDAYGERSSLEDMERALAGHEANMEMARAKHQRKGHWGGLHEAYGERKSLRDVERAMEFYEVQ